MITWVVSHIFSHDCRDVQKTPLKSAHVWVLITNPSCEKYSFWLCVRKVNLREVLNHVKVDELPFIDPSCVWVILPNIIGICQHEMKFKLAYKCTYSLEFLCGYYWTRPMFRQDVWITEKKKPFILSPLNYMNCLPKIKRQLTKWVDLKALHRSGYSIRKKWITRTTWFSSIITNLYVLDFKPNNSSNNKDLEWWHAIKGR